MFAFDITALAEDDDFRSGYVRSLVQARDAPRVSQINSGNLIPKTIVQFWHDSGGVPEDVQECLNSWKALQGRGFRRVFFDDDLARKFLSKHFDKSHLVAFDNCYHPAMRCDYFRLCYLMTYGGFYVDADERYLGAECSRFFCDGMLKVQPLCYDKTTGEMVDTKSFMIERISSPEWIYYINNNPIISPAGHPLIRLALKRATRILLNSSEKPEIQSTTGPGNLTASLVNHSIASILSGRATDFQILSDWDVTSISQWPLGYRSDERNWRFGKELRRTSKANS